MALGKGGSSGNQSGTSNTQTAGNSSTAGINGSFSNGITQAIAPSGYEDAWRSLLGGGGQTPGQTSALNFLSNGTANSLLNPEKNNWYGAVDRNNNIQPLTQVGGFTSAYGQAPQAAQPGQVNANPAAAFMGAYKNPYTQDVVNATTADMNNALGTGLNEIAAQYGGQYGNGRAGVAMGQAVGDYTRGLGSTIGNLRSQGFNTALGAGQFDAGQNLQGQTTNAQNTMAQDQFNAQLKQQRDFQDAQLALQANGQQMGNTATAANIGLNAANSAAGIGGQQYAQRLGALSAGNPLIGQSASQSNKGGQLGANDMAGNSDTQSSGKSSSKGGGLSIG